jgi:hypothetical protein
MTGRRGWVRILWGAGIGLAAASYLWGTSAKAALVAGDKIIFTLVIPMALLLICLASTLASAGRNAGSASRK